MRFDENENINTLLENGFLKLSEKKWNAAKEIFNKAMKEAPKNPYSYIGGLLEFLRMTNIESLSKSKCLLSTHVFFKKAIQYADDDLKKALEEYDIQARKRVDTAYNLALKKYNNGEYDKCYELLNGIESNKDVVDLRLACSNKMAEKTTPPPNEKIGTIPLGNTGKLFLSIFAGIAVIAFISFLSTMWDPALVIFLGVFVSFPVVWALVSSICAVKEDYNNKRLNQYLENNGENEIKKAETFMKEKHISLPSKTNDMLTYMESLLKGILKHYREQLKKALKKADYSNSFTIANFGTLYYNSKNVLIYDDVFAYEFKPALKPSITYTCSDAKGNKKSWSLEEIFQFCENLAEPNAYKNLAKQIPINELYWYVEYPTSAGYKLTSAGVDAVVGGVLLGPVGALMGAVGSSKKSEKKEKDEIRVLLGQASATYWQIAKGEYETKTMIETLNRHFPKRRLSDSYKNHI